MNAWTMCALRDKVEGLCRHPWTAMDCGHTDSRGQHLEENSPPLIRAEEQLVTKVQSGDRLCLSAPYTQTQTSLAKAATVTSPPQAGKSRFGSWQRKFSRSLALTSCCHWVKLHEQPHTKPLAVLPKGRLVSSRRTVRVHTSSVQTQTVFFDVPWCTLEYF